MTKLPPPTGRQQGVRCIGGSLNDQVHQIFGTHLVTMDREIYEYRYTPGPTYYAILVNRKAFEVEV